MRTSPKIGAAVLGLILACVSQVAGGASETSRRSRPPALLAAGDIGACTSATAATAAVISRLDGTVATLGDNAYPSGSADEFARCYDPWWGRFKSRTRPSAGNHEYLTPSATGYFGYFGQRAGHPGRGYYGYRLGTWQVVVLNSNCGQVGGCGVDSAQERWLRAYLRGHPRRCTLAYWHHPRFSTGLHSDDSELVQFWRDLYEAGAESVLNGHDHNYQRFAPLTPEGQIDPRHGVREFVVGTGGANLTSFTSVSSTTETRNDTTFGVLRIALGRQGYSWRFIAASGGTFRDAGSSPCHGRP